MSKISKASKAQLAAPRRQLAVPARSRIAVNKSVQDITAKGKPKDEAKKNSPENEQIEEVFSKNIEIAIALMPTVPFKCESWRNCLTQKKSISFSFADMKSIQNWIAALLDGSTQKKLRSSYLSVLILQMQNFQITDPFDKDPPKPLPDITKFFSVNFRHPHVSSVVIAFVSRSGCQNEDHDEGNGSAKHGRLAEEQSHAAQPLLLPIGV